MKFKYIKKEGIEKLPKNSGVYCFKNKEIFYIGKAANIRERVKNHFQRSGYRNHLFLDKVEKIGYIKTDSEIEALILEASLIKKYQPKYNIVWRDDKNYFYIGVTKEDFPRVFITHQPLIHKAHDRAFKGINYVGPFVDGKALKKTLKVLRKIFPYRSCRVLPKRPCLWYHLNYCPAPCLLKSKFVKEITKNSLKIKKNSQKNAKNLIKILKEGKIPVLKELKKEMRLASKNQEFEEAAKIRDQISALEKIFSHSKIFQLADEYPMNWKSIEEKMKKIFKERVERVEGYDVSNIQGKETTGSMVTFIKGKPEKNFYRRFKIKIEGKPNDIAMIKEILKRRLSHPEWKFPDLILIDGGRGHFNAAVEIKNQKEIKKKIKIISLAKKENKLFIEGQKKSILLKNLPREIFNLILQVRDEAHRFAISYHRKLKKKKLFDGS